MQRSSQTARKGWHRGAPIILEVGLEHDRMELGTVNVVCNCCWFDVFCTVFLLLFMFFPHLRWCFLADPLIALTM
jgi:hypothetical protein